MAYLVSEPVADTRVTQGGRVVLPASLRRRLGIAVGDAVVVSVEDGAIVIRPRHAALTGARERIAAYLPRNVSLAEQLIAERRAEAARERGDGA